MKLSSKLEIPRNKNRLREMKKNQYFFKHQQMDFELQIALGGCYYQAGDAGEIFSTARRVRDGDFESWFGEWFATAERVRGIAETAAAQGCRVSARRAYLRSATYYALANVMVDGTGDPSRLVPTWKRSRAGWDEFCARLEPPAEQVKIPYENTTMPGYFFRPEGGDGGWPTIIFNNGSDGITSAMWSLGIAAALERGYAALTFDGPGQNALLWLEEIPFRHDWEKVISPVVDYLLGRGDIDPGRIVLSGVSQGGYWILRALAFEHRIAAGIADPGVMDVSTAWVKNLPKFMLAHLEAGEEDKFNREINWGMRFMGKAARANMAFRLKPYRSDNYFKVFKEIKRYNLREVIGRIQCPIFIADPEDEQFWPGQSREVYRSLKCPKTIVRFTAAEGANWHCEPQGRSLYDQRVFDWLESLGLRDKR
jgi:hypothetical protein